MKSVSALYGSSPRVIVEERKCRLHDYRIELHCSTTASRFHSENNVPSKTGNSANEFTPVVVPYRKVHSGAKSDGTLHKGHEKQEQAHSQAAQAYGLYFVWEFRSERFIRL